MTEARTARPRLTRGQQGQVEGAGEWLGTSACLVSRIEGRALERCRKVLMGRAVA